MAVPAVLTLVGGIVLSGLGWLAATGRLPRNNWAGIRVRSTMRSDAAWEAGHRAAGSLLVLSGVPLVVAGAVLLVLQSGQGELHTALVVLGSTGVTALLVFAAARRATKAAQSVE